MLGRGVALELLGPDASPTTALERAAPLEPRPPRIVMGEEFGRRRVPGVKAAIAHEHREQALDLPERPGRGPAEGTVRLHSAPLLIEHLFERIAGRATLEG
jgi:hypothetical protein